MKVNEDLIEDISFEEIDSEFKNKEELLNKELPNKETQNPSMKINFIDEDFSDTLTSKKKLETNDSSETEKKKEENPTENKEKKPESGSNSKGGDEGIDDADYQDFSEFLIEGIDLLFSSGLKATAKDKLPGNKYEAPFAKKQKLIRMLSKILAKHRFGLTIEQIFFATIVMVYFQPAKEAYKTRMENNEKERIREEAKIQKLNTEETSENDNQSESQEQGNFNRKAGRPKKTA